MFSKNFRHVFVMPFILISLVFGSCITNSEERIPEFRLETGISFGMCVGYCKRAIQIEGKTATIIVESWRPKDYPTQKQTFTLTDAEYDSLLTLLDVTDMSGLEEVIGCPDCADGGAEWLAIEKDGKENRSKFNYGADIPDISSIMNFLRPIRQRAEEMILPVQ
ncbi:MAG: hypothetical protein DWQ10_10325 [Calditrichaeota bacterium]|nr:MAG: hypothetical protein DWQ10_10325 [Calditrichota bacterium]